MRQIKFEKTLDCSWIRKAERVQPWRHGQVHLRVEEKVEIREMEGGVDLQGGLDPQSHHQQRGPELDIPSLQTEIPSQTSVQFEFTFSEPMMIEPTFTEGPSTQSSYIGPSFSGPTFIEPTYIEIPQPQAPLAPDHAPSMDLLAQISSLGTCMEELTVVNDTRFYSLKDRMDQYQTRFTSQFECLQQRMDLFEDRMEQRITRIEDRIERQHEEMMAYLCFVFPPPPSQP